MSAGGAGLSARWRSLTALSWLLIHRRLRQDWTLISTIVAVVAAATMLTIVAPAIALTTIDGGARGLLEAAPVSTDIVISATVGDPAQRYQGGLAPPEQVLDLSADIRDRLPESIASVTGSTTLTVLGDTGPVIAGAVPQDSDSDVRFFIGLLTPENTTALALIEGTMPDTADPDGPIEIVISEDTAATAGVGVGSVIVMARDHAPITDGTGGTTTVPDFVVVGIVENTAADQTTSPWIDSPMLWEHQVREKSTGDGTEVHIAGLTDPAGLLALTERTNLVQPATLRIHVDPAAFTVDQVADVTEDIVAITANQVALNLNSTMDLTVMSDIPDILAPFPAQARAALAQMSIMMAGLTGVAAIVVILVTGLLIRRRSAAFGLERARGASVPTIGLRTAIESLAITASGGLLGVLLAVLIMPGSLRDPLPVVIVAAVAFLAPPLMAMRAAHRAWFGKREPANRRDRAVIARRASIRRLVIALAVIVLAIGSVLALRSRGLLQSRTDGVDPLLASAPVLASISVAIIVLWIYPWPVRAIGSVARRTRGVLGLLGSVRAQGSISALPLLALTLSVSLVVSGALLIDTVRNGQDEASKQRVGADVRIDAELDPAQLEELAAQPGVTGVTAMRSVPRIGLDLGTTSLTVTVMAVDESYSQVVAGASGASVDSLTLLADAGADDERLPVVVDAETAARLTSKDFDMYFIASLVPMRMVGTTTVTPAGYLDGPFVFVDLDALSERLDEPLEVRTVQANGPGAEAAADELGLPAGTVLSRADWVEQRRSLAMVAGVERTMLLAVGMTGLLALVAMIATVVGGSGSRGRTLSLLRTLGMPRRLGWWLALAELTPLIIASVVGGVLAGIAVVLSLGSSLGLEVLTGGTTVPAASVPPSVVIVIVGGAIALLIIGTIAEGLVHRRDRLSEVLRVGETV